MTRDLVERARKGDHDAFAELAGAAISRLDATAWLMLRDVDRATDAVQNALVRAWRDLPTLRDPDRFDAWLHRLLVNACIDVIRRDRRRRFDVDVTDLSIPAVRCGQRRPSSRIATSSSVAFSRLEPEERAVIVLHHYLDLPLSGGRRDAADPVGHHEVTPVSRAAGDARGARRRRSTRDPTSVRAARHEPRRYFRPDGLRLAPRRRRAPGAGAPRCRPAADPDGATATGMVEPRKVAPRADDTSLREGARASPRRCARDRLADRPGWSGHRRRGSRVDPRLPRRSARHATVPSSRAMTAISTPSIR